MTSLDEEQWLLETRELGCVRADRRLFQDLSLGLGAGELLLVEGPNGVGKTSLLKILCGLLRPDAGHVLWRGREIGEDPTAFHRELLYLGHRPGLSEALSPLQNLAFLSALHGRRALRNELLDACEAVGLAGYEELPAGSLSAGQRRRVALARLWLAQASIWVLDEPFTALDRNGIQRLEQRIGAHLEAGGLAVLTTHQSVALPNATIRRVQL